MNSTAIPHTVSPLTSTSSPSPRIGVVGLGYVGLPLALLFASRYTTLGFDLDHERVDLLQKAVDYTREVDEQQLKQALDERRLTISSCADDLCECNFYVVAVPTPVDANNRPDLRPLLSACRTVGAALKVGDTVVFESTVYPGVTEEECVPVLEEVSGLHLNADFFVGYSPERVNPGDRTHTVAHIRKVTSGSTPEAAERVDAVYASVVEAGTHRAPSIRVAEAAKIIENAQRDVNIAFMNELAKIFSAMDIDTHDVLEAASTKWNFLPFSPGLVGGHCIGVDPYYLIQKAQVYGVLPRVMSNARRLNDGMGAYVAEQVIRLMNRKGIVVKDARVLVMGFTFKENCPDIRNTKVADIVHTLADYTSRITIVDPWADPQQVQREYGLRVQREMPLGPFDAVVAAVAHSSFANVDLTSRLADPHVVYDVKAMLPRTLVDRRL